MITTAEKLISSAKVVCLIILFLILTVPAIARDKTLHNSKKKFTKPAQMSVKDWSDPQEMERTWQAAIVRIPISEGKSKLSNVRKLKEDLADVKTPLPTVIYLHGCSGIWPGTYRRVKLLSDNGYLVIAPASFARKKYPRSCDTDTHTGGLYRGTLRMRQNDAGYAIERVRALPFVDGNNIFLVGLSQGGITTATFTAKNELQKVKARVVEGWTCHADWSEYAGINAPESEPVLTLVGSKDPWYQNPWTKGNCTRYLSKTNGSKSVVYKRKFLSAQHELLDFKRPKREVLKFLREQLAKNGS